MVDRGPQGVPHGRSAARIDARQSLLKLSGVAGEVRVERRRFVEIHDEDFVFGIG